MCRDESVDVVLSATLEQFQIVEQGGCKSSEAVDAELVPAIELAVEPNESADVSVLNNFIRKLEVGKTNFDAEVDDVQIHFFLDDNTDAEKVLDMQIYENQDPLSCDHLALHLPKCKGCSGCDMGKTFKIPFAKKKATASVCLLAGCNDTTLRGYGPFGYHSHGTEF